MRAFIILNLNTLRSKYWLVPALMALGAIALAISVVAIDRILGAHWIESVPWLYANEPTGARSLLSTIAGSMITVAGVTFSITIAALATTASTFGPRLISNFMQDRGNQVTLGTFISTFLFCVLVLRTVRTGEDEQAVFVPHLAIIIALLFALASLGVLIYFIHHIPESINISNVLARLGRDLHDQVEEMFPESLGRPASEAGGPVEPEEGTPDARDAVAVTTERNGYIQYVYTDGLMKLARNHDLLVELCRRPGDFVSEGRVLARISPPERASQEILDAVRGAMVVGEHRSQQQDVLYLVNRLVEVAARALSPGMNDIFTATNAIDWLGGSLGKLAGRKVPEDARRDDQGNLRIIAHSRTFEELTDAVFDQLRPYAAGDRNAALHLMRTLADIASRTEALERRARLLAHAKALRGAAHTALSEARDLEAIDEAHGTIVDALSAPRIEARKEGAPAPAGPGAS